MIKVRQIKVKVDLDTEEELLSKITKKLNLKNNKILDYKITKKSIDARDKNDIYFIYEVNDGFKIVIAKMFNDLSFIGNIIYYPLQDVPTPTEEEVERAKKLIGAFVK